jgi:carbon storage regulator
MLVLSRHKAESIMIGDDVEIKVVSIRRNEIRLAIEAPRTVSVHRKEVYVRIQCEKGRACPGYPYFYVKQDSEVPVGV